MRHTDWKDRTADFKTTDVFGIQGNFFQGLKEQGKARSEICEMRKEKFGEKDPDAKV